MNKNGHNLKTKIDLRNFNLKKPSTALKKKKKKADDISALGFKPLISNQLIKYS